MADEIPARQFGERVVASARSGHRHPFLEQRVGQVPAAAGAAADHGIELCLHDDVGETLHAVSVYAGALEDGFQLLAGQLGAAAEGADDGPLAPPEERGVELETAIVGRHRGADAGRSECQHPADVFRRDEMPRRPQDMGAKDPAFVDRPLDDRISGAPHPQRQCPFRVVVFLRLDRTEPADDVFRFRELAAGQALVGQPSTCDVESHRGLSGAPARGH